MDLLGLEVSLVEARGSEENPKAYSIWGICFFIITYPKPSSIYVRGTIDHCAALHGASGLWSQDTGCPKTKLFRRLHSWMHGCQQAWNPGSCESLIRHPPSPKAFNPNTLNPKARNPDTKYIKPKTQKS